MATNLNNRLFGYFFIIISNISHNYINFTNTAYDIINIDLFAYITMN